jgi:signal transduction histidine kinase
LYIAREIAKANGGQIEACAQGGEIVFSVRLPRSVELL